MVGPGKRDLVPLRRSLAELRPAEEVEAGAEAAADLGTDALHDLRRQLLAEQTAAVEDLEHGGADLVQVVVSKCGMQDAFRVDPVA